MPELSLRFLGAPQIQLNGLTVETDRRKAIAMLAYLAVTAVSHTRDSLATLLWPDFDQSRAYAYLRRTLWELNNTLGEGWIKTTHNQIVLPQNQGIWLDTAVFQTKLITFRTNTLPLSTLAEAIDLYRGDFLVGFTLRDSPGFDEWQRFQAEQLRRELAWGLEQLAVGYGKQEEWETAVFYARRWLSLDPLQETAHRQLMSLYAGMGDRTAALRQYETCVRLLADELGIQPEPETTARYEQIRTNSQPTKHLKPQPATPYVVPLVLPAPPTPFVGRHTELAEIGRLLLDPACRLLTLVGPGGTGKTRLSIQIATHTAESFPDGVYFVSLAPLSSSDSILPALANVLNFHFYKEIEELPRQQLLNYLRQKRLLFVLDNFEHLLDEQGIQLPVDILATAPNVKILATSRTRLKMQGEQLFVVPGMRTPPNDIQTHRQSIEELLAYSAIQLFRQSAERVQPGFQLTAENIPHVVHICQLVQGMPLAIELAAAWIELLSPAEIAAEIKKSLDFLETDMRDVPERQRSIRAVFESSWRLLTEEERQVFPKLTVFWGSFTQDAARFVSGASFKTLLALVNKSWLQRGENGRYQIHILLLQYAYELLVQNPTAWGEAKAQHSLFYATFVQQHEQTMLGPQQRQAYDAVAQEFENIRAAWFWLVEQRRFDVVIEQMLPTLLRISMVRTLAEELMPLIDTASEQLGKTADSDKQQLYHTILLTEKAVFLNESWVTLSHMRQVSQQVWDYAASLGPNAAHQLGTWYILATALFAWNVDRPTGIARLRHLLPELQSNGSRWWVAWATKTLGQLLRSVNENEEAGQLLSQALVIYEELGDQFEQAVVLEGLGELARGKADYAEAKRLLLASRDLYQAAGSLPGIAVITFTALAELEIQQGHFAEAFHYIVEGREIYMQIGNRRLACNTWHWESLNALRYSTLEHARRTRQQHLLMAREIQLPGELAWGAWEMGEICRYEGDYVVAQRWFEEARDFFGPNKERLGMGFYHRGVGEIALAQGQHNKAQYHFQEYHRLAQLEHFYWSVAYADTLLGWVCLYQGYSEEAYTLFGKSLQMARELGNRDLSMAPLAGLAEWLLTINRPLEAAQLGTFVQHHPLSWQEVKGQAANTVQRAMAQLPSGVALIQDPPLTFETAVNQYL